MKTSRPTLNMNLRIFATLFILSATAGCSLYDVAATSTDLALDLFTDRNKGKKITDDDYERVWNQDTSDCIRVETEKRDLEHGLDVMFERIENDKEFVVLPTGEKYPIEPHALREEPPLGPTGTCLAREAE